MLIINSANEIIFVKRCRVFSVRQKVFFFKTLGVSLSFTGLKRLNKSLFLFRQCKQFIYTNSIPAVTKKIHCRGIYISDHQESVIEAAALTKAAMMLTLLTSPLHCALKREK
jgi:hypothetical protein